MVVRPNDRSTSETCWHRSGGDWGIRRAGGMQYARGIGQSARLIPHGSMLDAVEGPVKWYYEGRGTSVKLRALIQMDMLAPYATCFDCGVRRYSPLAPAVCIRISTECS